MKTHGMVVKVKSSSYIVLTPEGEYLEVPLGKGSRAGLGRKIEIIQKEKLPYFKFLMVAASLLAMVLVSQLFPLAPPTAAAYLTIDINPSVELAVDSNEKVVSARGLDPAGEEILTRVMVKGQKLQNAVARIVSQAMTDQFLCAEDENIILATLTVEEDREPLVDLDVIYEAIENPVRSGGVRAEIIIEPVAPQMREDAVKTGLSTGKFLVLQKSGVKGVPVSAAKLGESSLGNLEKTNKISIIELIREEGVNGNERSAGTGKSINDGNDRAGIYHEGRDRDPDYVKLLKGKTTKTGADHGQGGDQKAQPGKSDAKYKDKSKNQQASSVNSGKKDNNYNDNNNKNSDNFYEDENNNKSHPGDANKNKWNNSGSNNNNDRAKSNNNYGGNNDDRKNGDNKDNNKNVKKNHN
jgi:hypothetical protein